MVTIAESMITAMADHGVSSVWGVVGDALNPLTDAIRREERIQWIGTRHEETAAFAAGAQSQLTGTIGVCMGTVGPGSLHLLNGLYDAAKTRTPVLAICGQVPLGELGSDFFQEVRNDVVFSDVAVFCETVTSADQMPRMLEQAVNAAYAARGVAVLSIPGDVGGLDLPEGSRQPLFTATSAPRPPEASVIAEVHQLIEAADRITLLVGKGAQGARSEVLALADALKAPIVLTLKAKEGLEADNPFEIGQSGLIGNPASKTAFDETELLLMIGTDFPYPDWLPHQAKVVQVDSELAHIGRRIHVDVAVVADARLCVEELLRGVIARTDSKHLDEARAAYLEWREDQQRLAEPDFDHTTRGFIRRYLDNTERRIRPEALAAALDAHADQDAIFTADTGMSVVWMSRFIRMTGQRRMLGSFNLGSMANAMPQALGAAQLAPTRQVIALCGDGGLSMLLGDLLTAVAYQLPVTLVVFNNGRLGMVKLEQEQGGLPEFGTQLDNPDFAAVATAMGMHATRVEDPEDLESAVSMALATPGPVLLDVVTNPEELALPPKASLGQAWGFAIAKSKETLRSRGL